VPTYQYACTVCGHQLEAVQSFTDEPLTECPECTGRLRKLFSSVGVVFKGSGFYRTDSRAAAGEGAKGEGAKGEGGKKEPVTANGNGAAAKDGAARSGSDSAKSGSGATGGSAPAKSTNPTPAAA
jgi:putative FmdB family regulatory protein